MNRIKIDLERISGEINPHIFGGFAELLGHVVYGSIYDPQSPLADEDGLRSDVREALQRLNYSIVRFPGGNFVSGYRWMDGVGPRQERPARLDLAWNAIESNQFGTNEFIQFCRKLNIEPYLCINCGDGDMREARDWVEYCNGKGDSALANLRRKHGFEKPHGVKYWGIGNEVDGPWQIGYKTAQEYARVLTEFAKVMKWTDPDIKLIASANCIWGEKKSDWAERGQLIIEQAGDMVDYMSLHWYVGNEANDYKGFMAVSELFEERLSAYEGLMRAICLERGIKRPIHIAVDEWGIRPHRYSSLEDALVTAMNLNAFIRHANVVKMANLTMLVTPMQISSDSLVLQTIFYPFELYRKTCGQKSLDVSWDGDTFDVICEGHTFTGIKTLDIAATLDKSHKQMTIYVINRSQTESLETTIFLADGQFMDPVQVSVINGKDIKTENTSENPDRVGVQNNTLKVSGKSMVYSFEPHSITVLICPIV
jgi:alpha-N-arabinofuranosidase